MFITGKAVSNIAQRLHRLRTMCSSNSFHQARRVLISALLSLYILSAVLYVLPASRWRDWLIAPVKPGIEFYGLWQWWAMFSPEPDRFNAHVVALIWYDNKTCEEWEVPRMSKLGFMDRLVQERWHKYMVDHLKVEDRDYLWPDLARYVAYHHNSQTKHPVSIQLIRRWKDTPPPEYALTAAETKPGGQSNKKDPAEREFFFFNYDVKAKDLNE